MEKKTKYLIITLCCILGLVLGTTTAWYTWTSGENTDVTFTIGGITITYEAGDNIDKNLRPTSSKTNEEYAIQKDIDVSSSKTAYINLRLTVNEIATELNDRSFKWEVYEVREDLTEVLLNDGNFKYVEAGDKITILPDMEINNTEKKIRLYIWIDGNMENPSSMGGQPYSFVLSADASDKLPDSLQTLTNLGLNEYLNEGTPDFSTVETETLEKEIYSAIDDLGTSYYFRGAAEHNYLKFGGVEIGPWEDNLYAIFEDTLEACEEKAIDYEYLDPCYYEEYLNKYVVKETSFGEFNTKEECLSNKADTCVPIKITDMYFRIIRINGDGTIRLIYEGEEVRRNGETLAAPTKEDNSWYISNILNTGLNKYVSDAIYCVDNSIVRVEETTFQGSWTYYEYYGAYERFGTENQKPSIKCSKNEDKYTSTEELGNGKLSYPIGTITVDEIVLAGGRNSEMHTNNKYYLYTGFEYGTATPAYIYNHIADLGAAADHWTEILNEYIFVVNWEGNIITNDGGVTRRPVISLKADTQFTGIGTWDDPFVIKLS